MISLYAHLYKRQILLLWFTVVILQSCASRLMIFTIFIHKVSQVTIFWQSFTSPKVLKCFSDKLSETAEVNQEFFNRNVAYHVKLLNDVSKFQKEMNYREEGQKKDKENKENTLCHGKQGFFSIYIINILHVLISEKL